MRKKLGGIDLGIALEKIFYMAPDAIIITDKDNKVIYFNPRAEDMFGYSTEEAVGKDIHELIATTELHASCDKGVRYFQETGQGMTIDKTTEWVSLRKNGEEFPIELSLSKLPFDDGTWGAIGFVRDISERKKREKEAAEAEERLMRMETADSFGMIVDSIIHDIRNFMTSIMGFASLLEASPDASEKDKHFAHMIVNGVEKVCALSNNLLRMAKGGYSMNPLDINDIAEDIYAMSMNDAHRRGISICRKLQPVYFIMGSYGELTSVVLNIVTNAKQAVEESEIREIVISTENFDLDEDGAEVPKGKYVRLSISDTGCGMNEETQRRLFEKYFTTKKEGTGIGVTTAIKIVERHSGYLRFSSKEGEGTEFRIYLPCLNIENIE